MSVKSWGKSPENFGSWLGIYTSCVIFHDAQSQNGARVQQSRPIKVICAHGSTPAVLQRVHLSHLVTVCGKNGHNCQLEHKTQEVVQQFAWRQLTSCHLLALCLRRVFTVTGARQLGRLQPATHLLWSRYEGQGIPGPDFTTLTTLTSASPTAADADNTAEFTQI